MRKNLTEFYRFLVNFHFVEASIRISSTLYDEAKKLITSQTYITTNAGGDADIFATDIVDAKVRGGGVITIHGKPKQINQKTVAGGRIEEAKK